jgi:hypothetical protein
MFISLIQSAGYSAGLAAVSGRIEADMLSGISLGFSTKPRSGRIIRKCAK